MGNVAIIDRIAVGGALKGFFVLEDAFLQTLDLLGEPLVLYGGVSFSVSNGGE